MGHVEDAATLLDVAEQSSTPTAQLSTRGIDLDLEQAYAVQEALVGHRVGRGERQVGIKMGFTSLAKARQMGVDDVIWGRLTDGMRVDDGGTLSPRRCIHPRAEPEIAFLLGRDLDGPTSALEVLAAVEGVAPAIEVIDSRYDAFQFSLVDVVADNASSCAFVVGPWRPPGTDLGNLGFALSFDGRVVQVGSSAAILGHPVRSLVAAARLAASTEEPLRAGSIVMAGGATAAEPLRPGALVRLDVDGLGSTSFTFA